MERKENDNEFSEYSFGLAKESFIFIKAIIQLIAIARSLRWWIFWRNKFARNTSSIILMVLQNKKLARKKFLEKSRDIVTVKEIE